MLYQLILLYIRQNKKKVIYGSVLFGLAFAGYYFRNKYLKKYVPQRPPSPKHGQQVEQEQKNQANQVPQIRDENVNGQHPLNQIKEVEQEQENSQNQILQMNDENVNPGTPNKNGQEEQEQENQRNLILQEIQIPQKCPIIEKIYNATCRARDVAPEFRQFVGLPKNQQQMLEEYGNFSGIRTELKKKLNGMRRARGDGNCFYTSFGFQYLSFVLSQSADEIFGDFIRNVATQPWIVILGQEEITETQDLNIAFQQFCTEIRNLPEGERGEKFYQLFSDVDCQLYGLTVIYLRNLAYNFCLADAETKEMFEALGLNMKQQILEWEYDCENNQSVIALLCKKLNLTVSFFFIDNENRQVIPTDYKPDNQSLLQINLLFRPGHYNIGIPI